MNIKKFEVGPLFENCYAIYDENAKQAIIIDPGDEPDLMLDFLKENDLNVKYIICTHGHFDHIGAVKEIKEETGALILLHEKDLEIYRNSPEVAVQLFGIAIDPQPEPDRLIQDGENIKFNDSILQIIHTPGHSPGSICIYMNGNLFTGDTLFAGSVGRTDILGGSMKELLDSLKKISSLPGETVVFPGHGPKTKLEIEIKTNPFYHEVV